MAVQFGCRHGWIVSPDEKTVIDPTRWSFEKKIPYIYRGPNDDDYDLGAERFKLRCKYKKNFPAAGMGELVEIPKDPKVRGFIDLLLGQEGVELENPVLAMNQIAWIANQPICIWGKDVLRPVFEWIDSESVGLIPIDAKIEVLGRK